MAASGRRILFISSCVRGGGAGWSLYYILKHLDRSRVDPLVVVPTQGIFRERFAELGVRVLEVPRLPERASRQRFATNNRVTTAASSLINAVSTLAAVPLLRRIVADEGVEAIHCNNMLVKAPGVLAARRARIPAIFHARNIHQGRLESSLYGNLARLRAVRRIISNSNASAAPYRRYAPDKVVVVHNGVDLEEYRPDVTPPGQLRQELGVDGSTVLVGFTGNLIPRKGLEPLIHAATRVLEQHPNTVFVAVGRVPIGHSTDYKERYESLARERGIESQVRFVGFRQDVRPAVVDFDVFVMPSFQEPFGRSIIEAMALGTPVVASRVGGVPEILSHDENGLLVAPGDVEDLAGAIGTLVADGPRRERLARTALETVKTRFDVAVLTRKIEDSLLEVLP